MYCGAQRRRAAMAASSSTIENRPAARAAMSSSSWQEARHEASRSQSLDWVATTCFFSCVVFLLPQMTHASRDV